MSYQFGRVSQVQPSCGQPSFDQILDECEDAWLRGEKQPARRFGALLGAVVAPRVAIAARDTVTANGAAASAYCAESGSVRARGGKPMAATEQDQPAELSSSSTVLPVSPETLAIEARELLAIIRQARQPMSELKRLRRAFARRYHPDRVVDGAVRTQATLLLGEINAALDDVMRRRG